MVVTARKNIMYMYLRLNHTNLTQPVLLLCTHFSKSKHRPGFSQVHFVRPSSNSRFRSLPRTCKNLKFASILHPYPVKSLFILFCIVVQVMSERWENSKTEEAFIIYASEMLQVLRLTNTLVFFSRLSILVCLS